MITVHSTVVKNTTQLRLKTPVVNVRSARQGAASNLVKVKASLSGSTKSIKSKNAKISRSKEEDELTTTSPFIILNEKKKGSSGGFGSKTSKDVSKVIDGNAVLSNFNVDDLSDDERRAMLTNILSVIQSKNAAANELVETSTSSASFSSSRSSKSGKSKSKSSKKSKSSGTKLLPVTKANNVRIISSMDELSTDIRTNPDGSPSNAPIYVVLLPQNKKKK